MRERASKKFKVLPEHGRVKAVIGGRRVLVAIPGNEITIEQAEEWGLLPKVEPEAKPVDQGKLWDDSKDKNEGKGESKPSKPSGSAKKAPAKAEGTSVSFPTKSSKA